MRLAFSMISAALILFFSGPSWAQLDESSWLMSTRGRSEHRVRPPASSATVLELLQIQYPKVKNPHRVRPMTSQRQGYRKDIDAVLANARAKGKTLRVQQFRFAHGNPKENVKLLSSLVPDVAYRVEGQSIFALGEPEVLDQVAFLCPELDLPANSVCLDFKLVEISAKGLQQAGVGWHAPAPVSETVTEAINGQQLESRSHMTLLRAGYFTRGCR